MTLHAVRVDPGPAPYGSVSEALQKSLYFFDAQKSGPARSLRRQPLRWRGDSEMADAEIPLETGTSARGLASWGTNLPREVIRRHRGALDPRRCGLLDLSGGFHDAGDHVKFGITQAFAASTLAWSMYEFPESFAATGTYEHALEELTWFCDYFLRSLHRSDDGRVVAFTYMVGRGHLDHPYWGPPELQHTPRSATIAHAGDPASDQAGMTAAALALMSLLTARSAPGYSADCLDAAGALYDFGVTYRGLGHGDGFYPSFLDEDKLAWAAVWLYVATGRATYLEDILRTDRWGEYCGYLGRITSPDADWRNVWVYSWSEVWAGVFALLARLTTGAVPDCQNRRYWHTVRWNLEFWSGGRVRHRQVDGDEDWFIPVSPAGYSVLSPWGSSRFNAAAQWCALVYRKYAHLDPLGGPETGAELSRWARSQMNYLMGDNPLHRSYLVGFTARPTDHYVSHPHHRAAHGSTTHDPHDPAEHRHILWGALVGGPDAEDRHTDSITARVGNGVALDHEAVLVAALAGLFSSGGPERDHSSWTLPDGA